MKAADLRKQELRIRKRCTGCQFADPEAYEPYERLWPYIVCTANGGRKCFDVVDCPKWRTK